MFHIHTFTEVVLATLTTRVEKHGDDDVPAISLGLHLTVPNTMLDSIDPTIREALFKRPDGQPALSGMEDHTPALRCNSIERAVLTTKYEGWTLRVDDGLDDTTPAVFVGCKCDKFSVEPLNGGSCLLRMRVGTSDIDAESSGMLAMHVGQSIWIMLQAPEVENRPAEVEDVGDDEPDATDLFISSVPESNVEIVVSSTNDSPFQSDQSADSSPIPITVKRTRKGIGPDADQAERQRKSLAEDDALAGVK